jgi:hypothetical protein
VDKAQPEEISQVAQSFKQEIVLAIHQVVNFSLSALARGYGFTV